MTTIEASSGTTKEKVVIYFLSSTNEDDIKACKIVHKHLSQFIRNSNPPIEIYNDYSVNLGQETDEYKETLYKADMVIAFGSADFIADQTIINRLNKVIVRYNNRQTRLLAIIVRNFMWKEPFFGHLKMFPSKKVPLYDLKTWSIDDAFTAVAQELKDSIVKYYNVEQTTIEIKHWD